MTAQFQSLQGPYETVLKLLESGRSNDISKAVWNELENLPLEKEWPVWLYFPQMALARQTLDAEIQDLKDLANIDPYEGHPSQSSNPLDLNMRARRAVSVAIDGRLNDLTSLADAGKYLDALTSIRLVSASDAVSVQEDLLLQRTYEDGSFQPDRANKLLRDNHVGKLSLHLLTVRKAKGKDEKYHDKGDLSTLTIWVMRCPDQLDLAWKFVRGPASYLYGYDKTFEQYLGDASKAVASVFSQQDTRVPAACYFVWDVKVERGAGFLLQDSSTSGGFALAALLALQRGKNPALNDDGWARDPGTHQRLVVAARVEADGKLYEVGLSEVKARALIERNEGRERSEALTLVLAEEDTKFARVVQERGAGKVRLRAATNLKGLFLDLIADKIRRQGSSVPSDKGRGNEVGAGQPTASAATGGQPLAGRREWLESSNALLGTIVVLLVVFWWWNGEPERSNQRPGTVAKAAPAPSQPQSVRDAAPADKPSNIDDVYKGTEGLDPSDGPTTATTHTAHDSTGLSASRPPAGPVLGGAARPGMQKRSPLPAEIEARPSTFAGPADGLSEAISAPRAFVRAARPVQTENPTQILPIPITRSPGTDVIGSQQVSPEPAERYPTQVTDPPRYIPPPPQSMPSLLLSMVATPSEGIVKFRVKFTLPANTTGKTQFFHLILQNVQPARFVKELPGKPDLLVLPPDNAARSFDLSFADNSETLVVYVIRLLDDPGANRTAAQVNQDIKNSKTKPATLGLRPVEVVTQTCKFVPEDSASWTCGQLF